MVRSRGTQSMVDVLPQTTVVALRLPAVTLSGRAR